MEQDKRSEPRLEINTVVEVECADGTRLLFQANDLSDHGASLYRTDGNHLPPLGSEVQVRVTGLFGERARSHRAEVVNRREDGIGIRFL